MNTWYYRQADQEVGPFERDVLDKLRHAGVIDDTTAVKTSNSPEWRAFGEVVAEEAQEKTEPRYYYLDANQQVVGPFDLPTLGRLQTEGVTSRLARAVIGIPWALAAWYNGEIKSGLSLGEYRAFAMLCLRWITPSNRRGEDSRWGYFKNL